MLADLNILAQKLEADRSIKVVVFQSAHPEIFVCHADTEFLQDMSQKVAMVDRGEAADALLYLFNKKENELGYRVLLTTTDHAVLLIQFPGRIMWSREEALADITAVEVVELPFSPSQANFETLQEEFGVHPNGRALNKILV